MNKRPLRLGYFMLTLIFATIFLSATLREEDKTAAKSENSSDYLVKVRNNQVTGQLNPADYLRAVQQVEMQAYNRSGQDFGFDWKLMGPNNLGGRTRAIIFDNRESSGQKLYAGGVLGGVFVSTNGGAQWEMISHESVNMNVSCMTQAGNGDIYVGTGEGFNVQEYTVLKEWGYSSGFIGQGIFKSTDGENFSVLPSTKPTLNSNNELEWGYINELAAHPSNGAIYAATNTGLKFSSDGGNTWQTARTNLGDNLTANSKDVKMAANGLVVAEVNNLCYVSENGNPDNFFLRSGDSTWNIPTSGIGRMEFAIPPTNNDMIYALAVTPVGSLLNVYRSDDKGLTWTVIGPGGSPNFNVFNTGNNINLGIGMYAATIEVYPDDPFHVLVGGQDMWEGKKIQDEGFYHWTLRSSAGLPWLFPLFLWQGHHVYKFQPGTTDKCFIGTNGGISLATLESFAFIFQFMNRDYIASQFYTVGCTGEKNNVVGGAQDIGTIFINGAANPNDAKRGNDIWTTQAEVPDGATGGYCANSVIYPSAFIYSRNPQPANNGNLETFVRRNEFGGGADWAANMFSDKYASSSFLSPFLLYEEFDDVNTRDSVPFKATRSYPAGSEIWIESANGRRPFKYVTPVALSPGDSINVKDLITARFFIGGDDRVMMSKQVIQFDKNPEWYVISNKAKGGVEGKPSAMAYSSDANHLFAGTLDGKLYRISNIRFAYNTETADVNSPYCVISTKRLPIYLPGTTNETSQVITSIAVDPNNDNRVIVTMGNYGNQHYVYMTENALDENPVFRSVQGAQGNGGLPQVPAYASLFEMDPENNLVIIGTEFGIYVTDNINATQPVWVEENDNVGRVPVFMLRQQTIKKADDIIPVVNVDTTYLVYKGVNNYGVVYGATYGRGLIMLDNFQQPLDIDEPGNKPDKAQFMIFPNPATDRVTVAFDVKTSGNVSMELFNLTGNSVRKIDLGNRPTGKHEAIINVSAITAGTYILRLNTAGGQSASKFIIQ